MPAEPRARTAGPRRRLFLVAAGAGALALVAVGVALIRVATRAEPPSVTEELPADGAWCEWIPGDLFAELTDTAGESLGYTGTPIFDRCLMGRGGRSSGTSDNILLVEDLSDLSPRFTGFDAAHPDATVIEAGGGEASIDRNVSLIRLTCAIGTRQILVELDPDVVDDAYTIAEAMTRLTRAIAEAAAAEPIYCTDDDPATTSTPP